MRTEDFGVVECIHWATADHVRQFIDTQGIASMLAFAGDRCVGQLYVKTYDPMFTEPKGWIGERPWADFQIAEPLPLRGQFITLGCYHVGGTYDGEHDPSLWGRGIATSLLQAVVEWCRSQPAVAGLLSWGLVSGSKPLLQWAGQLPHTTYRRAGFSEIKRTRDPRLQHAGSEVDTAEAQEDPTVLRVMVRAT